jgi:hypothetical protein
VRVLVACEYSGTVRDAFRARGHDAWSCDLLPCERDPAFHIEGDVLAVIDQGWDLMIAHPPCTHLSSSGAAHFWRKQAEQKAAVAFVRALLFSPVPRIAIENPVGVLSSKLCKPSQIIQPWQFGHPESKSTCLWLKQLPKLRPTWVLKPRVRGRWENQTDSGQNTLTPSDDRWKERSRTYQGIADAMADQWGGLAAHLLAPAG